MVLHYSGAERTVWIATVLRWQLDMESCLSKKTTLSYQTFHRRHDDAFEHQRNERNSFLSVDKAAAAHSLLEHHGDGEFSKGKVTV